MYIVEGNLLSFNERTGRVGALSSNWIIFNNASFVIDRARVVRAKDIKEMARARRSPSKRTGIESEEKKLSGRKNSSSGKHRREPPSGWIERFKAMPYFERKPLESARTNFLKLHLDMTLIETK